MKIVKVNNLPQTYEADTIYLVKSSTAGLMDIYVTDNTGTQIRSLANGGPDGFRTYRTVSTSLPSGVPRQGEEWIMVE